MRGTRSSTLRAACGAVLAALVVRAAAGIELGGAAGTELRGYWQHARFEEQDDYAWQPSLLVAPELRHEWDGGRQRLTLAPFARLDGRDDERTHADLREAHWLYVGSGWDLMVGVAQVYWGVAEARHLVNITNQVDGVEDVDEEDRLGQPLVNLNLVRGDHRLGLYLMAGFRERSFPGDHARLRGALPVAEDDPVFASGAGRGRVDAALRYALAQGPLDLGLVHFSGTGREPRLVPRAAGPRLELQPHYDVIDQTSVDAQLTLGGWAFKLEALTRSGQGARFGAAVAGFEYTLYEAFGGSGDLGLLTEYLYDGRGAGAPGTPFEDDLFVGLRWSGNDLADTHVLFGLVHDLDGAGQIWSVEAGRRLGERVSLGFELRAFERVPDSDVLSGIRRDDFAQLRLLYWF